MSANAIPAQGTLLQIATGTGGAKTITGVALSNPCVITAAAHGFSPGDRVTIAAIVGTTQLNGNTYTVEYVTTNTFSLLGVNSTGYGTWVSGGTATPVTFTTIGDVKTFSGLDGQAAELDATDLNSTAKEKKVGLLDEGGFSFTMNRVPSDAGQAALLAARAAATSKQFKMVLPSGTPSTATFTAFVKQLPIAGGVDQIGTSNVALAITGSVAWT